MIINPWVPLPTRWIEEGGLQKFNWGSDGEGANYIVALMVLVAIAHHADDEGVAKLTYDTLCAITTRSRAKVSCGLTILETFGIVEREPCGQSSYKLTNYSKQNGWGKLPARNLYASDYISAFNEFQLRKRVELNAP